MERGHFPYSKIIMVTILPLCGFTIHTHLPSGEQYKRKAFDPSAVGLEGLEWDGAELYMVSDPVHAGS